jgi:hypothetical protein
MEQQTLQKLRLSDALWTVPVAAPENRRGG